MEAETNYFAVIPEMENHVDQASAGVAEAS